MKAVQITEPRKIEIVDKPPPSLGRGEVLIRIKAAGICGTDLHLYKGAFGNYPIIPGHDVAGRIEEVGTGVSPIRIGERVTIDPADCCLKSGAPDEICSYCQRGATNLCVKGSYMGISSPGAMVEFVAVHHSRAVVLPPIVDDETATALEPLAVALHLLEKVKDRPGDAWIIGGGPIGIVAALLLQNSGRRVTIIEPLANRRMLAKKLGMRSIASPDESPADSAAALIVEASGHSSAADTIAKIAAPGSTIVLVGGDTTVPGLLILTRELEVRAVKGGRGLYPQAVALAAEGKVDPGILISHRFPVGDIQHAFAMASRHSDTVIRAVLDMNSW